MLPVTLPDQEAANAPLDVPIVPTPKDNTSRAPLAAILFVILAPVVATGVSTYLSGLHYPVRNGLVYLAFGLGGVCGLSAIIIGRGGLRAALRVQPLPKRAITLARTAITLGAIELVLAVVVILLVIKLSSMFGSY